MGDTLKRLAFSLGLTKSTRRELSDIVTEETTVIKTCKEEAILPVLQHHFALFGESGTIKTYFNYFVKLMGSRKFEVNDYDLFSSVNPGDKVKLSYQDVYEIVSDYSNSDFSRKAELERNLVGIAIRDFERL